MSCSGEQENYPLVSTIMETLAFILSAQKSYWIWLYVMLFSNLQTPFLNNNNKQNIKPCESIPDCIENQ